MPPMRAVGRIQWIMSHTVHRYWWLPKLLRAAVMPSIHMGWERWEVAGCVAICCLSKPKTYQNSLETFPLSLPHPKLYVFSERKKHTTMLIMTAWENKSPHCMKLPTHPEERHEEKANISTSCPENCWKRGRYCNDEWRTKGSAEWQPPSVAFCKEIIMCPFPKPLKSWCPAAIQNVSTIKALTSFLWTWVLRGRFI